MSFTPERRARLVKTAGLPELYKALRAKGKVTRRDALIRLGGEFGPWDFLGRVKSATGMGAMMAPGAAMSAKHIADAGPSMSRREFIRRSAGSAALMAPFTNITRAPVKKSSNAGLEDAIVAKVDDFSARAGKALVGSRDRASDAADLSKLVFKAAPHAHSPVRTARFVMGQLKKRDSALRRVAASRPGLTASTIFGPTPGSFAKNASASERLNPYSLVKLASRDKNQSHFLQRLIEGRGGKRTEEEARKINAAFADIFEKINRASVTPSLASKLKFRDSGGNMAQATHAGVVGLPRDFVRKMPGKEGGQVVVTDTHPARGTGGNARRYTMKTVLDKNMSHSRELKPISFAKFMRTLAPGGNFGTAKTKTLSPKEADKALKKRLGFTGPGSAKRWSDTKSAVAARQSLPAGATTPGGHPAPARAPIPGISKNRQRKMTRLLTGALSRGKIKLGGHVEDRAFERAPRVRPEEIAKLRSALKRRSKSLRRGETYHHTWPGRGHAVIGDVGKSRPHHVVKTVLRPDSNPPGRRLEGLKKV